MAAYCRVYDPRRLQADCQEPGSAPEPCTLGNRVWAIFLLWTDAMSTGALSQSMCEIANSLQHACGLLRRIVSSSYTRRHQLHAVSITATSEKYTFFFYSDSRHEMTTFMDARIVLCLSSKSYQHLTS